MQVELMDLLSMDASTRAGLGFVVGELLSWSLLVIRLCFLGLLLATRSSSSITSRPEVQRQRKQPILIRLPSVNSSSSPPIVLT